MKHMTPAKHKAIVAALAAIEARKPRIAKTDQRAIQVELDIIKAAIEPEPAKGAKAKE